MVIIYNGCIKLYISLEWLLFIYRKQVFFALLLAHDFGAKDFVGKIIYLIWSINYLFLSKQIHHGK